MTAAVVSLLAGVVSLLLWWVRRRDAAAADPVVQRAKANEDADEAVARGAGGLDDVNRLVQRGLDGRLRAEADGDPGGP
jgi:hypothetical protein